MAAAVATRRLPGIAFEARPPAPPRVLPRMDVTAFVGFAAAGPLHVPVAVEDADGFANVFGEDAPLPWDVERGAPAAAQLAPAVRSYFRNGGRRAWIVRVASGAYRSSLPVPGLVERVDAGEPAQAQLAARAAGSWADDLRVGSALLSAPVRLRSASAARLAFQLETGATRIAPGDLLRIAAGRVTLLAVVCAVRRSRLLPPGVNPPPPGRNLLTVLADPATALWLERIDPPYGAAGLARYTDATGRERCVPALLAAPGSPPGDDDAIELDLQVEAAESPVRGTLVEWREADSPPGAATLWLPVEETGRQPGHVRVRGRPEWTLHAPPDPLPAIDADTATAERLELELTVLDGDRRLVLSGLGFAPEHPRYLGDLPTDEELYTPRDPLLGPDPGVWASTAAPRFPLARCDGGRRPVFAPIAIGVLPDAFVGPLDAPGARLDRDGLARFGDELFLDDEVRGAGIETLITTSDHIQWQRERPRALTGIHALLDVEEVTIVAVPDAGQRGWSPVDPEYVPPAPPTDEEASPPSPPEAPKTFVDCALHELEPTPELELVPRDQGGSFGLEWSAVDEPGARYVLQEGTDPDGWESARTLYTGPRLEIRLYGRTTGTHFYRVRAEAGPNESRWSNGVSVGAPAGPGYALLPEEDYTAAPLLAVQRALLRMCAARGDMLAVLSLPEHYRVDAAIEHVGRLRAAADVIPRPSLPPAIDPVFPLGAGEQRALGFGALYHPWLALSVPERGDTFRIAPPDGTVAGVIARRAATRGAWVAPANEPFADAIALVNGSPREALAALQEAQVNELRQEAGGFLCLCADTLAPDDDLRPITVRRLLSLVRRLALREGAQYVFEPNDPVFRRDIERGFGEVLQLLHMLGAFAGRTPEQGYRVNVGDPPNTARSVDQGRLIVELKLAPSRPLAFLLVRLIHAGERGLQIEAP
jgi:hypothetical protein